MARLKIDVKPSLQRLDLAMRGLANTKLSGNYASTFKGQGLEFSSFRSYGPSDDASTIDWTTSNRARKLLVKEYQEERNIDVYFLVDVSSRMLLSSTAKLKAEYAAELVASFSNAILRAEDHVGLTMFADKITRNVRAEAGMKHFHVILDALSNTASYGGSANFKDVLEYAISNFKRNSIVFLVSDFTGNINYEQQLKYVAKKFDLIGVMVSDPVDLGLPAGMGQALFQDPVTGEKILVSPKKIKASYSKEVKRMINMLGKMFKDAGSDFLPLDTSRPFGYEINGFFNRRRMQWS